MYPLLASAALVIWLVGAVQLTLAFRQAEPALPFDFRQDRNTYGFAVDIYIWNRQVPDLARRRYLRAFACFLFGFVLLAIGSFVADDLSRAVAAAAASVALGYATWKRWRQYRDFHSAPQK